MSPQQIVTWSDVAQKFVVPLMLATVSLVGGWTATELASMRSEIKGLQIRVAELSIELKMHREQGKGG